MSTTQPIKNLSALDSFKQYYLIQKPNERNHVLIILGLNTALRISDILDLRWKDVYDSEKKKIRNHLEIKEKKTGKTNVIALNSSSANALFHYKECFFSKDIYDGERFLFESKRSANAPLSRSQAFRIIKEAAIAVGLENHISCHSLRKTFGYHAWKQGTPPALLMNIYNHSSYQVTKRYLCIEQDDKDEVFLKISL